MSYREVSEVRDGMQIDWDVPITMDDGLVLRADVFRPVAKGKYPVLLSYGPYGKWLHFEDGYKTAWSRMVDQHPDVVAGSTNKYQSWEVCDPEKWVPDGYVCVRVDSRGCGRSPGHVEHWSPREAQDFAACIEWAGTQKWSNGKVGLSGISYYAMNQWQVAALQPKHLAALCIWEGAADFYRDLSHHGGIYCTFAQNWYDMQVRTVQYGLGPRGYRSRMNGDWVSGPDVLTSEEMGGNRFDLGTTYFAHALYDDYWKAMMPDFQKIKVPLLSTANWGGQGLHPRGNFEGLRSRGFAATSGWRRTASSTGPTTTPTTACRFRRNSSPISSRARRTAGTRSRRSGCRCATSTSSSSATRTSGRSRAPSGPSITSTRTTVWRPRPKARGKLTFDALGDGLTFLTAPLEKETEITGPIAARLAISSSTSDADLFLIVRVLSPEHEGDRVPGRARSAHADRAGLAARLAPQARRQAQPSLSALSHPRREAAAQAGRGLRRSTSRSGRPASSCRRAIASRSRCAARDYVYPGGSGGRLSNMKNEFTGCGPFLHDDPRDRPVAIYGGKTTIHFGKKHENWVMLPVIPGK